MEYPFPLPVLSKLPKLKPGDYMYCPVTPKEIADYFKTDDLPMLGILPKKSKEYWDALAKKYPEGENFIQNAPVQLLVQQVLSRLTSLYPKLIRYVMDTSPLSPAEKGLKMVADVTSLGAVSAIDFARHKLVEALYGCSIHQLDLSSPSVTGTIDKYLGSSHSVLIAIPIPGQQLRHATVVTKQPDGKYSWFDSNKGDKYSYGNIGKKLQNFVGSDKEVIFENYCAFQTKRGVCVLWSLLFIIFPDRPKLELLKMLETAKVTQQLRLPSDLILISIFEDFVAMTDRKLDELPPSIKAKLRTALGGRRKTRRLRLKSIKPSHKSEKKWDATFVYPDGHQKVVPFGAKGMSDYTKHKDKTRRLRYLKRHSGMGESWQKPDTPGALAKWVLWNKPSLRASIADYKKRFKL